VEVVECTSLIFLDIEKITAQLYKNQLFHKVPVTLSGLVDWSSDWLVNVSM